MLRAAMMRAEIGCGGGLYLGFSVSVRDRHGVGIYRASVVIAAAPERLRHRPTGMPIAAATAAAVPIALAPKLAERTGVGSQTSPQRRLIAAGVQ
jgi:hypothetical protein